MATLDDILEELLDHLATRTVRKCQGPRWRLTCEDVPRGYMVIVELYGEPIVEAFGRSMTTAKQRAHDALRVYVADQEEEITRALELSIQETAG